MNRSWVGIRASAVLAILGSLFVLLMAGVIAASAFVETAPQDSPVAMKPVLFAAGGLFAAFAVWGIATGIAIFLRKRWSRVSILIFAGLLAVMGVMGMVMVPFIPMTQAQNPDLPENFGVLLRIGMAGAYGICAAIGVWWLVLFTRPPTKDYYGSQEIPADPRPLSIRIIAWFLLVTGILALPASFFHFPTILFGAIITGWLATFVFLAYGFTQIILGSGLLRMLEWARLGTIALIGVFAVSAIVTMVRPGYQEAVRRTLATLPSYYRDAASEQIAPVWLYAVPGVAMLALALYFLVRRKAAFASPAA